MLVDRPEEDGGTQVWVCDPSRNQAASRATDLPGGVQSYDWGPDGERLVVSSRPPREEPSELIHIDSDQHKYDGDGWLDGEPIQLFVVNRSEGTSQLVREEGIVGARASYRGGMPRWGPTDRIAFLTHRGPTPDKSTALDVCVVSPDGSSLQVLTEGVYVPHSLAWSPSGRQLAVVERAAGDSTQTRALSICDVRSGDWRTTRGEFDRTVARGGDPVWISDTELAYLVGDRGRTQFATAYLREDSIDVSKGLAAGSRSATITAFDAANGTVCYAVERPSRPRSLLLSDVVAVRVGGATGEWLKLRESVGTVSSRDADDAVDIGLDIEYRSVTVTRNGIPVEGHLYLPDTATADDPVPLVVRVHGGPMTYYEPDFDPDRATWIRNGYAVYEPNYTGSRSYGQSFASRIRGDWGPREVGDVLAGTETVSDSSKIDGQQVFLYGFSQGAYYTARALVDSDQFAAAICEKGFYDLASLYGAGDLHLWYEEEFGYPWEDSEAYRGVSVLDDVDKIETPVLVVGAGDDGHTPIAQSEQFYIRLRRAGAESSLVVYPEQTHMRLTPSQRRERRRVFLDWFDDTDR